MTSTKSSNRITIPVSGMTCAACQGRVQRVLEKAPGVEDATVNLLLNNASVRFDPNATSPQRLVETIRGTGYGAELPAPTDGRGAVAQAFAEEEAQDRARDAEFRDRRRKAIVSLVAAAISMILSMPFMAANARLGLAPMTDPFMRWQMHVIDPWVARVLPWLYAVDPRLIAYTLLTLTVFVMAWAGRHFYVGAWKAFRHHAANMDTLIAVGTGAAFLYSVIATVAPGFFISRGVTPDIYYEAVIFIIALVLLG